MGKTIMKCLICGCEMSADNQECRCTLSNRILKLEISLAESEKEGEHALKQLDRVLTERDAALSQLGRAAAALQDLQRMTEAVPRDVGWHGVHAARALIASILADPAATPAAGNVIVKQERLLINAMQMDSPYPITSVLQRLTDAVEHLFQEHNCDMDGWENWWQAFSQGRKIMEDLRAIGATPFVQEERPELTEMYVTASRLYNVRTCAKCKGTGKTDVGCTQFGCTGFHDCDCSTNGL